MRNGEPNTKKQETPKEHTEAVKPGLGADQVKGSDSKKLSAEEQLAAYEESLKEDDWGHQPC